MFNHLSASHAMGGGFWCVYEGSGQVSCEIGFIFAVLVTSHGGASVRWMRRGNVSRAENWVRAAIHAGDSFKDVHIEAVDKRLGIASVRKCIAPMTVLDMFMEATNKSWSVESLVISHGASTNVRWGAPLILLCLLVWLRRFNTFGTVSNIVKPI